MRAYLQGEFRLLEYLMENRGRVLTRESIMTAVWGEDFLGRAARWICI